MARRAERRIGTNWGKYLSPRYRIPVLDLDDEQTETKEEDDG